MDNFFGIHGIYLPKRHKLDYNIELSRDNLYMRYDENADTLEFDWFQNEPSNRNLEDSSQWHSVNEARRVFGRKPVDKFLTRYLSCGIDTVKVQVIFHNMQLFSQATKIISGPM